MPTSKRFVLVWLLLTVLLVLFSEVCSGAKVMDMLTHEIHVEAPAVSGTLRLTVKKKDAWVYHPDVALIPFSTQAMTIECASTEACTVTSGECSLSLSVSLEISLSAEYSCNGNTVTKLTLSSVANSRVKFQFPQAMTLYGLAEHAADLPLRQGHSYAMYNTDAFQYRVNSTEALYGSIPFVMAYAPAATTGVLFLNAAEMNVRIDNPEKELLGCDWDAETGVVDLFFMPGPTPASVQQQHAALTGSTFLPPYFSLGYHQSRWNYLNTHDCLTVNEKFDEFGMPYDVLWLDIEHTAGKKYFTWDSYRFPDPKYLVSQLEKSGRKLVTVKDPHVKREVGYFVHEEALKGQHYVETSNGVVFRGRCWPGESSWPDFVNERTRNWYAKFFHDDVYPAGGRSVHTWVDMNEPSVFEGEKGTMLKGATHMTDEGIRVEHRFVHNAYSLLSILSVFKGSREAGGPAAKPHRPFILTRSFFPGMQRYAAMWNGDNAAKWDHLQNTIPELLSLSISNYPFVGCDIGGFFSNPTEELSVRWMQAGVFFPFFRSHNHMEAKRREPYMVSEENLPHMQNALRLRYALIPYLYTTFFEAHRMGGTIMRPLFFEFPEQPDLREIQDAFMFGPSLLAHPVIQPSATAVRVTLPAAATWYAWPSGEAFTAGIHSIDVTMGSMPFFLRSGHIVSMKLRQRRNTFTAQYDPFTLFIAVDEEGSSSGSLYIDDGETYDFEAGNFHYRQLTFSLGQTLTNAEHPHSQASADRDAIQNKVEKVVFFGLKGHDDVHHVWLEINGTSEELSHQCDGNTLTVYIGDRAALSADWKIVLL